MKEVVLSVTVVLPETFGSSKVDIVSNLNVQIILENIKMIKIIVACDENNGIGFNGKLPWHYPEDLKHFKELTYGNTIIAGRKTIDNLPNKCLPDRLNIFITNDVTRWYPRTKNICDTEVLMMPPERKPWPQTLGPWPVHNISYGIRMANFFPEYTKTIYIIGGSQIFNLALKENEVQEVILTRVPGKHKADAFFPMELIKNWKREDVKKEGLSLEIYNKMDEKHIQKYRPTFSKQAL